MSTYSNLHNLCIMYADYQNAKNIGSKQQAKTILTEITDLLIETNKQIMAEAEEQFPELK